MIFRNIDILLQGYILFRFFLYKLMVYLNVFQKKKCIYNIRFIKIKNKVLFDWIKDVKYGEIWVY